MTWLVGEIGSEDFSTGVAGETFARVASSIAGVATAWNPAFADLGSGFYRFTYTPTTAGTHTWSGTGSTSGPLTINFDVEATSPTVVLGVPSVTQVYATLADIKNRLDIPGDDPDTDAILSAVITSSSRAIDQWCSRFFYGVTATKVLTAQCGDYLRVPDLVSVSALATDDTGNRTYATTWATSDYDLDPAEAEDEGMPYTSITLTPNSTQWFPTFRRGVQIAGTWGWPSVPSPVTQACLLMATRLFRRPSIPFGLAGNPELAPLVDLPAVDPDVRLLLAPYRRFSVVAV